MGHPGRSVRCAVNRLDGNKGVKQEVEEPGQVGGIRHSSCPNPWKVGICYITWLKEFGRCN